MATLVSAACSCMHFMLQADVSLAWVEVAHVSLGLQSMHS